MRTPPGGPPAGEAACPASAPLGSSSRPVASAGSSAGEHGCHVFLVLSCGTEDELGLPWALGHRRPGFRDTRVSSTDVSSHAQLWYHYCGFRPGPHARPAHSPAVRSATPRPVRPSPEAPQGGGILPHPPPCPHPTSPFLSREASLTHVLPFPSSPQRHQSPFLQLDRRAAGARAAKQDAPSRP